jgi:DNA-directed RNA polymerase specialized sigma24 family protein
MPLVERLLSEAVARRTVAEGDAPDIAAEVMLRLVGRLQRLIEDPNSEPISRFDDYVSAMVHNALDDHRRRLDPVRARLEARIRYVLTHTNSLALWGRDPVLGGLSGWIGRPDHVSPTWPARVTPAVLDDVKKLRRVLEELFRASGAPAALHALVPGLATAAGISSEPFVSLANLRRQAVVETPVAALEGRQYLSRLWREIEELPVRQRNALLLQLTLDDGESATRVLSAMGIASIRRIAELLEMPLEDLLSLWNDLPLPDQRISVMLGTTRQQVINLRKSARERLARRMERSR